MIKQLLKDSVFYTFCNILTRGVGFLLLPVFTRIIPKDDYGAYDYTLVLGSLLAVVITLEIAQSVFRFFPEEVKDKKKQISISSTGFWFAFVSLGLVAGLIGSFSKPIALLLFDNDKYAPLVVVSAIYMWLNVMLTSFLNILRINFLTKNVVYLSLLNAIVSAVLSLLLVLYFDLGVFGLIAGQTSGTAIACIFALYLSRQWIKFEFNREILIRMLIFSFPLVFSSLGVIILLNIDRIMVKSHLGLNALAGYAVGIKLASIVSFLMIGFQYALTPMIYSKHKEATTPAALAKLFHYYLLISSMLVIILTLSSQFIVTIVVGDNYSEAAYYIPFLVASALMSSMYLFFPGLSLSKKTKFIAVINLTAGGVNFILNDIMIPVYGAIGAAYSTLFVSLMTFILNVSFSQFYYKVPINYFYVFCVFMSNLFFLVFFT